jgi:hypothetical protein
MRYSDSCGTGRARRPPPEKWRLTRRPPARPATCRHRDARTTAGRSAPRVLTTDGECGEPARVRARARSDENNRFWRDLGQGSGARPAWQPICVSRVAAMSSTASSLGRCARTVVLPSLAGRGGVSLPARESPAPHPTPTAGPRHPAPAAHRVNVPTHLLAFHTLLKAVAVDGNDPQTRQLLDHIAVEYESIEVSDRFDRDVSGDAAVGASVPGLAGEL